MEITDHKAHGAIPEPGSVVIARVSGLFADPPIVMFVSERQSLYQNLVEIYLLTVYEMKLSKTVK